MMIGGKQDQGFAFKKEIVRVGFPDLHGIGRQNATGGKPQKQDPAPDGAISDYVFYFHQDTSGSRGANPGVHPGVGTDLLNWF